MAKERAFFVASKYRSTCFFADSEKTERERRLLFYDGQRVKLWIRIDAAVRSDPSVAELASRLKISIPEAVGHCVLVWCAIAEHRPDGILTGISISALEEWGGYRKRKGKPPGAFGKVFTELFLSNDRIRGWESRQGKLVERMAKDRARKSTEIPRNSTESVGSSAPTVRNGTVRKEKATTSPSAGTVKVTWLTPYANAWKGRYGGELSFGQASRALAPLHKAHGEPETLRRWTIYLAATDGQFASSTKFASTWGEWDGEIKPKPKRLLGVGGDVTAEELASIGIRLT